MAQTNGHSHIKGWGSDLDHRNRPGYPKERMPARLEGLHWTQPEQQRQDVDVFHSIERPDLTPVFGTSVPPTGLSGLIRRRAFRLSENDVRHWLMLFLADRVNAVEGIAEDAWRSPRARIVAGSLFGAALLGGVTWLLRKR